MKHGMYIDGQWVSAQTAETRDIINPYNQEIIATVAEGNEEDAKLAIAAARRAFDQGDWATTPATERGRIVGEIARLIERDKQELAELESLDTGKTVEESVVDMDDIAGVFRYYAELADKDGGEIIESPIPNTVSKVVHEPVGVCGQITPWNYPLLQASWKLAPALVAGNTLVIKPSEITPLTTMKVMELMEEAGVPAGVANLVLGAGGTVGAVLSEHDDVDLISFTGGIHTGKKIMQAASGNVKKLALELGGKNPNVVFADSDFELAVDQAMNAVFFHAGQICSAGTRLIIEESIHDDFVEELVKRVGKIKLGSGFAEDTQMGPLISAEHLAKVEAYVEAGKKEGAYVAVGGQRPEGPELQKGFFYLPTVLIGCTTDMQVVQEEGFGPVITVEKFSSEAEAVKLANDSIYGLAGGVFTTDISKAERCAAKMRMGTVWINEFNVYFPHAPWGGFKQSGIGRELGKTGLEEYTEQKHILRNVDPQPIHWFGK
ncbi:betaine-aldehyde dehydrogenase [Aquibacillus sp. 3ASR75-11]|uniref:Betaine-aldehyde dehydrogenase n=1 Tax=Terrihalobacillus insolitus TaxID=2950438 RepID=A0A9X3WS94_9BACI|nr:betaine-aldehyde dehydrogenase [Terrihalobacillus insolitus]MDC3411978.1 betaine-aldehyde dehydrogenase [Terrihalobacillus insolitus]MDC3423336.1 betaine-aldehyde dehydrogenase [Terrihalobacillus insolitus]